MLYVDGAAVGTAGDAALGATALVANWTDIGTSDVKLAAKYIQTGYSCFSRWCKNSCILRSKQQLKLINN
jgi:hypothetical protein